MDPSSKRQRVPPSSSAMDPSSKRQRVMAALTAPSTASKSAIATFLKTLAENGCLSDVELAKGWKDGLTPTRDFQIETLLAATT